jgi:IMP cyclohydrolase
MDLDLLRERAQKNWQDLSAMPYLGRLFVIGLTPDGTHLAIVYAITSRNPINRRRYLRVDGNTVRVEAVDPKEVQDPENTLYTAMEQDGKRIFVSNGNHTTTSKKWMREERNFAKSLSDRIYETDTLRTSRIIGMCQPHEQGGWCAHIGVLRKSPWGSRCERHFFEFPEIGKGFGYLMRTYRGDTPQPVPYIGEPILTPIVDDQERVLQTYFQMLNNENFVAIATNFVDTTGRSKIMTMNKYP